MPYEISWMVENRVVYERLYGNITLEEMRELSLAGSDYLIRGKSPVHILADFSKIDKFPINLREINSMMANPHPELLGWMLGVAQNPVIRFLGTVIPQLQGARIRVYSTMEDALKFLQEIDDTLPVMQLKQPNESKG